MAHKIEKFQSANRLKIWRTALRYLFITINKIINRLYHKFFGKNVAYKETDFLILSIAVIAQREGMGSLLLKEAMLLSKKLGFANIGLYVRVENIHALNSYLKNDYVIRGYIAGQYYMEQAI
jgi:ribosomal protein S18 acetylase RimI-like enzyme